MKDIEIVQQLMSGGHLEPKEIRRAEVILFDLGKYLEGHLFMMPQTWEERVSQLEAEGFTRSDAQGAVDVEILNGWRPSDFQPWMLLPYLATPRDSKV